MKKQICLLVLLLPIMMISYSCAPAKVHEIEPTNIPVETVNPINSVSPSESVNPIESVSPIESVNPTESTDNVSPSEPVLRPSATILPTTEPQNTEGSTPSPSIVPTGDKSGYFASSEAQFKGVIPYVTTVDQMLELLGQPDTTVHEDTGDPVTYYYYGDVKYETIGESNRITTITITGSSDADTPRDIKVGDSLKSVMSKFPYEHDPETNDGIFFGERTISGQGGALYEEITWDGTEIKKMVITSESIDPFMIIKFKDDVVYEIIITVRTN